MNSDYFLQNFFFQPLGHFESVIAKFYIILYL